MSRAVADLRPSASHGRTAAGAAALAPVIGAGGTLPLVAPTPSPLAPEPHP